jgi:CheY-like chemotaxis protein
MTNDAPSILVIDDDEIVLAALAELLEAAQFSVRCQASPAGAADIAAADPRLVAVIVDLNMPIMRGDNVLRMFLSRARLRDLPLVLLSGDSAENLQAVRAKMPHVKVLAKADMHTKLVTVLKEAIAERGQRSARRAWDSIPSAEPERVIVSAAGEVGQARPESLFFERLAREMELAREVWKEVRAGRSERLVRMVNELKLLQVEADKLTLFQIGQLLRGVEQIGSALVRGSALRPSAEASVEKAIEALAGTGKNRSAGAKFVAGTLVDALRRAAAELRAARDGA